MDTLVLKFIEFLQTWPPECITLFEFVFFAGAILFLFRYFGAFGLCVFSSLGVMLGNIQVLKTAQYFFQSDPVALGSILFSMTYLSSDIITVHFGPRLARLNAFLAFFTQLFVVFSIYLTLGYSKDPALLAAFCPSIRILFASLLSFVMTQLLDISIFVWLKNYSVGFRSGFSTIVSGFVDHCFFSTLAWMVLAEKPCTFNSLIFTYILGTYGFRIFVNLWTTPIIYLSWTVKKNLISNIVQMPVVPDSELLPQPMAQ